jgi:hypothetical protein
VSSIVIVIIVMLNYGLLKRRSHSDATLFEWEPLAGPYSQTPLPDYPMLMKADTPFPF